MAPPSPDPYDDRSDSWSALASSFEGPGSGVAVRLAAEMARRWRRGERPRAEEFLDRHPELWGQPEAAADLVYEEICLRQELGEESAAEEVITRFPRWRRQLEVLLECHRILEPGVRPPRFPSAGESLGDFDLLAELGRGAQGRVFLATQSSLAGRAVVLKVTPCRGQEHLSLARLQHTNVVPLYGAQDDPARNLRVLWMPYFGGTTLARLLERLHGRPPEERSGADVLAALDQEVSPVPLAVPARSPARHYLARYTYTQAVCSVGADLADALQYAHERGLVHLDLKPSNVLLAADGQPMLLDFHLARAPLRPDGPPPDWLGGTPAYMAPEQKAAVLALTEGRPAPAGVGAPADIYSLGLMLYEALGGPVPLPKGGPAGLDRLNPAVTPGLADVLARCLAEEPGRRYGTAADLAGDLRRHIHDLPLLGVANRRGELWRKWRRREPHQLWTYLVGGLAVVAAVATVVLAAVSYLEGTRANEAQAVARQARAAADHEQAVRRLHRLAAYLRFYSADPQLTRPTADLDAECRDLWESRQAVLDGLDAEGSAEQTAVRTDLLDLVLLWTGLRLARAGPEEGPTVRDEAGQVLDETATLLGHSPALAVARGRLAAGPGEDRTAGSEEPLAATAADHYALGLSLYEAHDTAGADAEFRAALRLDPRALWPQFYHGVCAYRGKDYEGAVVAFTACVVLAPSQEQMARHLFNRAKALTAAGRRNEALADYDLALECDTTLAAAALNRGVLHYRDGHYPEALADLQRALDGGVDPATVLYNRALVELDQDDRAAALADLERALRHDPGNADVRKLSDRIRGHR
jgi:serine/threonine protein kinase/tetratricopeptide (TPR) repeat protein